MKDKYGRPDFDEFTDMVWEVYRELPEEVRTRISLELWQKIPESVPVEALTVMGFYMPMTKSIVLSYWGFMFVGRFTK